MTLLPGKLTVERGNFAITSCEVMWLGAIWRRRRHE